MGPKTYQKILEIIAKQGAAFAVLLDPDRNSPEELAKSASYAEESGADIIYVGSSMMLTNNFNSAVYAIKQAVELPVVIFPGDTQMISAHADAILFLCLVSSRNPELLIGQQVKAAPLLKEIQLEPIPTGYILADSGKYNAAHFMSGSLPIPNNKPDLFCAHALAAEYMGMKMVFTDAGSGAHFPVPIDVISILTDYISIPLCVGGGIRTPGEAEERVRAGADIIVIGTAFEQDSKLNIFEFADAIHSRGNQSGIPAK